jgi:hypothetical protein
MRGGDCFPQAALLPSSPGLPSVRLPRAAGLPSSPGRRTTVTPAPPHYRPPRAAALPSLRHRPYQAAPPSCRPDATLSSCSSPSGSARNARVNFGHSGTGRTKTYDVNVPFMQLERHGWGIHAVSAGPAGTARRRPPATKASRKPGSTKKRRAQEAQSPRSPEPKKRRAQEAQSPRSAEPKKRRAQEAQSPRSAEPKKRRAQEAAPAGTDQPPRVGARLPHQVRSVALVALPERAQRHLEGVQPAADDFGLPRVVAARCPFGGHRGAHCLQRR